MKNIKILALFLGVIYLHAHSNVTLCEYTKPFTTTKAFNRNVFLVHDAQGKKFVLKAHASPYCAILEKMGYEIGKNIVNIPHAEIISLDNFLLSFCCLF